MTNAGVASEGAVLGRDELEAEVCSLRKLVQRQEMQLAMIGALVAGAGACAALLPLVGGSS